MQKVCIVIADDHPLMRNGIRKMLSYIPEASVVGEASDGVEAVQLVKELQPDLLLLDLNMPKMDGIEVVRQLQKESIPVSILVLSAINDPEMVLGMLELGVVAYLSKEEAPVKLLSTVQELVSKRQDKNKQVFGQVQQKTSSSVMVFPKHAGKAPKTIH